MVFWLGMMRINHHQSPPANSRRLRHCSVHCLQVKKKFYYPWIFWCEDAIIFHLSDFDVCQFVNLPHLEVNPILRSPNKNSPPESHPHFAGDTELQTQSKEAGVALSSLCFSAAREKSICWVSFTMMREYPLGFVNNPWRLGLIDGFPWCLDSDRMDDHTVADAWCKVKSTGEMEQPLWFTGPATKCTNKCYSLGL